MSAVKFLLSCRLWLLSILQLSEGAGLHVNNGCWEAAPKDVECKLIMNQLIPLQMMDRVAMTTEAVLPRAWRRCLFPRSARTQGYEPI